MKNYYVYILTNKSNRVLYTGVTGNLAKRVEEHQNNLTKGFTSKYNCHKLVWYAQTTEISSAIAEEKRIKSGSRAKKIALITQFNPEWKDLSLEL